ncbi:CDP-diacylglycerol-serine O-phosphatidyltransferase [Entomortierella beljakovae]|nr:CDP-diacylglycerol-serine O-phosphatidyltransferase [Entomortierella beljakovae]
MWCIPLGFTFDALDGRVARWRKTSSILAYFEGTPIPTSLVLVAILAYLSHLGQIGDQLPGGVIEVIPGYSFHVMVLMFGLSGTLMVRAYGQ